MVVTSLEDAQTRSPITLGQRFEDITIHSSPGTMMASSFLLVYLVYQFLLYIDLPLVSIAKLVLESTFYAVPSRLLLGLDWLRSNDSSDGAVGAYLDFEGTRRVGKSKIWRNLLSLGRGLVLTPLQEKMARAKFAARSFVTSTVSEGPPGLFNMSTSCYQNSVLQGLASLPVVQDFLACTASKDMDKQTPLISSLSDLINLLNDPANLGETYWAPKILQSMNSGQQDAQEYYSKLVGVIDDHHSKASRDAYLVGAELPSSRRTHVKTKDQTTATGQSMAGHIARAACDDSAENPLQGLQAQRVGCLACGFSEGLTLIPFNCITLPLGKEGSYDIASCFDEFTALEQIHGVKCAKCTLLKRAQDLQMLLDSRVAALEQESAKTHEAEGLQRLREGQQAVQAALKEGDFADNILANNFGLPSAKQLETTKSKQVVIARAPRSLVIHINRSDFDLETGRELKNTARVDFPATLDISSWCLGGKLHRCENESYIEEWEMDPSRDMLTTKLSRLQPPVLYNLRAVVTHYGTHDNGHYTCYRKHPYPAKPVGSETDEDLYRCSGQAESWWYISDAQVWMVSEAEALQQGDVFMLFYESAATDVHCLAPDADALPTMSELTVTEMPLPVNVGGRIEGEVRRPLKEHITSELRATLPLLPPESWSSLSEATAIAHQQEPAGTPKDSRVESCANCSNEPMATHDPPSQTRAEEDVGIGGQKNSPLLTNSDTPVKLPAPLTLRTAGPLGKKFRKGSTGLRMVPA